MPKTKRRAASCSKRRSAPTACSPTKNATAWSGRGHRGHGGRIVPRHREGVLRSAVAPRPCAATQAGVKTYDDRYGRYSPAALAPHLAALKSLASALEETTVDGLEDEIDRTALLNDMRVALRRFERERPQAKSPAFWLHHLLGGLHFLLGR